jgi:hypothetical protein
VGDAGEPAFVGCADPGQARRAGVGRVRQTGCLDLCTEIVAQPAGSTAAGADRGMDVDIAQTALAAGHAVVATARNADTVTAAVGLHEDLLAVRLDVIDPADAEAAVKSAVDRFGRIDVLVNSAGYFYELSMRQVEISRTLVFDDPRRARGFFEALVSDNIGIGRPAEVHAVFGRDRRGRITTKPFRTRVFSPGTEVHLDFSYKHSRVKQYLKEGRALRIETVINKPSDIGVLARLEHLPELIAKARQVNHRVLMIERAGQGCAIGSALFQRIHQPYIREGQRTGAFRFGDQRAMALAGSLCLVIHAVTGFTNKSLRGHVAGLLGTDYSTSQMSYDLRRLRLHSLIERRAGTNSYTLTPEGIRVAVFYTKLHTRLLHPLLEADKPPAPPELRHAPTTIERILGDYLTNARLGTAAA